MHQNHIIKKQILNFTLDSEIGSFTFQNEVSGIFRTEILPIIDMYCNDISDASQNFRIDKLEINLGEIDLDNFAMDFKSKVSELFPQKLYKELESGDAYTTYIVSGNSTYSSRTVTQENKDFELLDFFIKTGRLPWWVKKDEFYDIPMILETQIKVHPEKIKTMMHDITPYNTQIKRLVYYTRDPILDKMIALLQGPQDKPFSKILKDLTSIVSTCTLLNSYNKSTIRAELWLSIFALCAASKKKLFKHEHIIKTVAKHISEAFHTNYNSLYIYLAQEMKGRGYDVNTKSLLSEELKVKEYDVNTKIFPEGIPNTQINEYLNQLCRVKTLLKDLIHDVVRESGNVTIYYQKPHKVDKKQGEKRKGFEHSFDKRNSTQMNNQLLKEKTDELERRNRALQEYSEKLCLEKLHLELKSIGEKKISQKDKDVTEELLQSIEKIKSELPQISELIFYLLRALEQRIDNSIIYCRKPHEIDNESNKEHEKQKKQGKINKDFDLTLDKRRPELISSQVLKEKTEELEKRGRAFQEYCEELYPSLTHALKTLHENDLRAQVPIKVHTFADSEEIYINNAGIVLFWPYLNAFFETVGLLENQQFVDEDKKERAVLLLHYLASGSQEACEYELMLNKILCGIDQDTPIKSHFDLIEKERNECKNLLKAVIQNWPALKNLSVRGLQDMFILREGMIIVRDGKWVLRVEEKAYDLLIDNMPWGIGSIKLQWMKDLLFVEWRL